MSTTTRSPNRAALLAVGLAVAGTSMVAGCSKASTPTPKTGTKIGPSVTVVRTTAVPTTAIPKTTSPPPVGMPTAEAATRKLYDAWKANDLVGAATVATPTAIAGIWASAPADYYEYSTCDTGEFSTGGCLYRGNPGTIQFDLTKQGTTWVVTNAVFSGP